jgi:Ca2+-binding EF-hand superfamily protein
MTMRKTFLTATAATLTLSLASGVALAQPADGQRPQRGQWFQLLDADRDGRITPTEAAAFLQARFDAADANRDGRLDLAEFRNLRPQRDGRPQQDGRRAERRAEQSAAMFRALDADRDGAVTLADLTPASEAMFRMADRNADGAVTQDEVGRRGRR